MLTNGFAIRRFEAIIWVPNVIAFIVMVVVGYTKLGSVPVSSTPIPPATVFLTSVTTLAADIISWTTMCSDYGIYHDTQASAYVFA